MIFQSRKIRCDRVTSPRRHPTALSHRPWLRARASTQERNRKAQAGAAGGRLGPNASTVGFDDALRDVETKARTNLVGRRPRLPVAIEDVRQLVGGDAG